MNINRTTFDSYFLVSSSWPLRNTHKSTTIKYLVSFLHHRQHKSLLQRSFRPYDRASWTDSYAVHRHEMLDAANLQKRSGFTNLNYRRCRSWHMDE